MMILATMTTMTMLLWLIFMTSSLKLMLFTTHCGPSPPVSPLLPAASEGGSDASARWANGAIGPTLDAVEARFGTPYHIEAMASDVVERLTHTPVNPRLSFPAPNPFIPADLTIKPLPTASGPASTSGAVLSGTGGSDGITPPAAVFVNGVGRLWHKQDDVFKLPRSSVRLYLFSPATHAHRFGNVLTELWSEVVDDGACADGWLCTVWGG